MTAPLFGHIQGVTARAQADATSITRKMTVLRISPDPQDEWSADRRASILAQNYLHANISSSAARHNDANEQRRHERRHVAGKSPRRRRGRLIAVTRRRRSDKAAYRTHRSADSGAEGCTVSTTGSRADCSAAACADQAATDRALDGIVGVGAGR